MTLSNSPREASSAGAQVRPARLGLWRFAVGKILRLIEVGVLHIEFPGGERLDHVGSRPGPTATVRFHNWRGVRRILVQGDIGLAEGFLDGDWTSPDVAALIEVGALNGQRLMDTLSGVLPFRVLNWIAHRRNANSKAGSRRNIMAHYDLGNDFYRLWLDRRMMYSSAIYPRREATLEEAQTAKLDRIVEKLSVSPETTLLEIGGGWGGLAAAVARAGARKVTSLTISPAQLEAAQALVERDGFADRVEFRLEDYRDARGTFDRIVSIEMIEAVGKKFMPKYFETIRDRLKPGGVCVLLAITIAEDRFADYCRRPDFIQRYIFPGGFLPSKTLLRERIERAGLKLVSQETFGDSYALTLKEWRRRFFEAWPQIEKLGFDAPFKRLWEYYLCYCEAGFRTGMIDVGLYCIEHAGPAPRLPQ